MKFPFPFLQKLTGLSSLSAGRLAGDGLPLVALRYLLAELPELLLGAVLAVDSGEVLAAYTAERNYQPAALAGPATAVVQQLQASLLAQGQDPGELREVMLTLPNQLHLLGLAPGGHQVVYLVAEARDTNLALARQLVQQAAEQLNNLT